MKDVEATNWLRDSISEWEPVAALGFSVHLPAKSQSDPFTYIQEVKINFEVSFFLLSSAIYVAKFCVTYIGPSCS